MLCFNSYKGFHIRLFARPTTIPNTFRLFRLFPLHLTEHFYPEMLLVKRHFTYSNRASIIWASHIVDASVYHILFAWSFWFSFLSCWFSCHSCCLIEVDVSTTYLQNSTIRKNGDHFKNILNRKNDNKIQNWKPIWFRGAYE